MTTALDTVDSAKKMRKAVEALRAFFLATVVNKPTDERGGAIEVQIKCITKRMAGFTMQGFRDVLYTIKHKVGFDVWYKVDERQHLVVEYEGGSFSLKTIVI